MEIKAVPQGRTITLVLTEAEAGVLRHICGRVSGHPTRSPRGVTSEVYEGLRKLGVESVGNLSATSALAFDEYDVEGR